MNTFGGVGTVKIRHYASSCVFQLMFGVTVYIGHILIRQICTWSWRQRKASRL